MPIFEWNGTIGPGVSLRWLTGGNGWYRREHKPQLDAYPVPTFPEGVPYTGLNVPLRYDDFTCELYQSDFIAGNDLYQYYMTVTNTGSNTCAYRFRVWIPTPQLPPACQSLVNQASPSTRDGTQDVCSNWGITDSTETTLGYLPVQRLFRPTNPYEISRAINQAEAAQKTIRACGSRWSFSGAVLPQSSALQGVEQAYVQGGVAEVVGI